MQKPRLLRYFLLLLQLGLFLVLVYQFNIDSRAFLHVGILTFFGFAIHYFLPLRFRLQFFTLLSLLSIALVFGFQLETWSLDGLGDGAWLIALGLGLIGIAHLPIAFGVRVTLVLVVGAVLAILRATGVPMPWSQSIWPILGSMFMFRLILYFYEIRHEKEPAPLSMRIAYFFMIPNVCFPLFPVVDYQGFRRTWYNTDDHDGIYQVGVHWMFRGLVQLLLYRLVYQNFVLDSAAVQSPGDLLQYLLWPFLLYLRVSGYFHLIVGMIRLFGFNLGETHRLYYLSSSFTDFWRRINIYWKDFMMKVFYYPVYLKARKLGDRPALILTTLLVFALTWVLHAYQWFWIRGTFLLTWNDGLFWAVLGILVVFNSLYEVKHGRRRRLKGQATPWRPALGIAARTIGIYLIISILWSFWSAHSVSEWASAWKVGLTGSFDAKALLLTSLVILAVGGCSLALSRGLFDRQQSFFFSVASVVATAAVLLVISQPAVVRPFGPEARKTITTLKTSELNQRDFARMERGYYENLIDVGSFNPELWEVYRTKPADWNRLRDTEAVEHTDGFPYYVLRPSIEVAHHGAMVKTNSHGMRDQEYSLAKPTGTFRVALLGSSFVFGSGVENLDNFESQLEASLNEEAGEPARFELLNFGVAGYSPLEHLAVLESRALEFQPDVVLYFEHADTLGPTINHLAQLLNMGRRAPFPYLREIAAKAGLDEAQTESADFYFLAQSLKPFGEEILAWIYRRMVELSTEQGVRPFWVYLPRPETAEIGGPPELELRLAQEAGFEIIDLTGLYGDIDLESIWVARWDHHPDARGHEMIKDSLERALYEHHVLSLDPGETVEGDESAQSENQPID